MPLASELPSRPRWLSAVGFLALALAAVPLGGCHDLGDITGSIAGTQQALPTNDVALRAYADDWGKRYDRDPGAKVASINYARALRALTRYSEAVAVMQSAAVKAPRDYEVLGAFGKALADAGQLQQAKEVLSHAYAPERPDWTIMSVQGAVADRLGDHEGAQQFYIGALKIAPGEPSVLSNLGLSYALTKQLPFAEDALRRANASPLADARVRDNLALILSLEGKFAEAEAVSRRDMSAQAAAANVQAIRRMIAQNESWRDLQTGAKVQRHDASQAPASPLALGQPAG
jgi:Flp pilus assembly protein TadD